ncbi:universal stress protein [Changchengzhania lutea]|uniref:universal stress protein n=1 Tax=Changchengzhania lutea TaxID=2049305 RepID=UPI00115D9A93|nr:universal stress protein [Changchengzhania lutea]
MKNILLPTDFSENSWNAIKYALNFFENETCNFYLLHVSSLRYIVIDDSPYIGAEKSLEAIYTTPAKQELRKVLKRIAEQFSPNKSHRFYTLSDYSFFIESIRKQVEEKKIDIIVMGTKGASGLKKVIVGSNTADVITKVKCTTLAIPENANFKSLTEIAFPTDFSLSYDIDTLNTISELLENHSASLRIIHISKKRQDLNSSQRKHKELLEDFFIHHPVVFHFLKNKSVEDAIQCFVESRNIDLICMIAKSLNYFQQILFHSKVKEISYHTDVPFLVLHEKKRL